MQFEQQQKLFSVEVRPYFEVNEVGNYFKTKYEKRVGYQYQLLVNGIPALQPHIITESKEMVEKTKDENIDKVANQALQAAQQVAQGVIDTYLGGAGTFVKLGKGDQAPSWDGSVTAREVAQVLLRVRSHGQ